MIAFFMFHFNFKLNKTRTSNITSSEPLLSFLRHKKYSAPHSVVTQTREAFARLSGCIDSFLYVSDMQEYKRFEFSRQFLNHAFGSRPLYYSDFSLLVYSLEYPTSPSSIKHIFRLIAKDRDWIDVETLQYLVEPLCDWHTPKYDPVCEILDMINPQERSRVVLKDLLITTLAGQIVEILTGTTTSISNAFSTTD
ncbi:hypothetical protein HDU99_007939 [Rhizoclosmatium hyalinum]|nr:hypothetical protein HDU99_007939 [Rhizoclosmatium hyalinum]